jgi:hypothetical protein
MTKAICIIILGSLPGVLMAQATIASPQKRMATLDLARELLTTKPVVANGEEFVYKNPFDPRKPAAVVTTEETPAPAVGLNDREILSNIANSITPSGTMRVGDKQILLFGQKKLKVGDSLPIVFQGTTYELQISGIERTSFTLRLNKEEITRPIKPVIKP